MEFGGEVHPDTYGYVADTKKWMNLIGVLWIQSLTGTNFDFSGYSSTLKQVLQISQVKLNNLAVASDLGKALGWISGYAMRRMPLWTVLLIATSMGLVGYGLQWLVITEKISSSYWQVYLLCLLAGNSICWLNTVCFTLCIRNFPTRKAMAQGLSTSYNGLTSAIFTLIVKAISLNNETLYLLLNAVLPLIICSLVFTFIRDILSTKDCKTERPTFIMLNIIAIGLGVYLLPIDFFRLSSTLSYKMYALGMVVLLLAPLCILATIHLRKKRDERVLVLDDTDNGGLHKLLHNRDEGNDLHEEERGFENDVSADSCGESRRIFRLNGCEPVPGLGQEHNIFQLVRSVDFWLYFLMYLCGATLGLAYSNNLGQIAESRGHSTSTVFLSLYSSSAFFGRLMSAAPDYFPRAVRVGRPGWMCLALIPLPPAFFYLATEEFVSLYVSTAIIGMCSGFIISTAVSTTPELFGTKNFGVNHNIVISNIPFGSLIFGYMAALIYDNNAEENKLGEMIVCMGIKCYKSTFMIWGCICLLGIMLNSILLIRTRRLHTDMIQ